MLKAAPASSSPCRLRALESADVRAVSGHLAEGLVRECGASVNRSELEMSINLEIDSTPQGSTRFWILERLSAPLAIASGPGRGDDGEGFDYVVWLNESPSPLKTALLRFWLEKRALARPCAVLTFCRAHGLVPDWVRGVASPEGRSLR